MAVRPDIWAELLGRNTVELKPRGVWFPERAILMEERCVMPVLLGVSSADF